MGTLTTLHVLPSKLNHPSLPARRNISGSPYGRPHRKKNKAMVPVRVFFLRVFMSTKKIDFFWFCLMGLFGIGTDG